MESTTTALDEGQCPVDEYPVFKEVMRGIQNTDPMWFGALTSGPPSIEKRSPQEGCVLVGQRKAAAESRRIEESGGYVFQYQTVAPPFTSGGTPFCGPHDIYQTSIKASEQGMQSTTTSLHEEECPVDECPVSKEVMRAIQNTDPMCFSALTSGPQFVEQKRSPQEICVLAGQSKTAVESRRVEESGAYVFQSQTAPPPFSSGVKPYR
ncbi:hypothetical protein V5799_026996 [Amblyomma americanum]|uniref:Uncharacterized protein n=1 Tax=Amblyomma americanum TaxID=6943 RepID=A0AAQ4DGZ6_AMBAM